MKMNISKKSDDFYTAYFAIGLGAEMFVGILALFFLGIHVLDPECTGHHWYFHFRWMLYVFLGWVAFWFVPILYHYFDEYCNFPNSAKISFKHYKAMKNIAPSNWTFDGSYYLYKGHGERIFINFSFFGWVRVKINEICQHNMKQKEISNDYMKSLLEAFQKDINKAYEEANDTIKKVNKKD